MLLLLLLRQVSWVKTRGKEGKVVYIYGLRRRAGQAASLSKPVSSSSSSPGLMWLRAQ